MAVADTRIDLGAAQSPGTLKSWLAHANTDLSTGRLVFAEAGIYSFNCKIELISGTNYPLSDWPFLGAYELHNGGLDSYASIQGTFASDGLRLPAGASFAMQFTNYYDVGDEIVVRTLPPAGWTTRTHQTFTTVIKIT